MKQTSKERKKERKNYIAVVKNGKGEGVEEDTHILIHNVSGTNKHWEVIIMVDNWSF